MLAGANSSNREAADDQDNGEKFEAMQDLANRARFNKAPVRAVTLYGNVVSQSVVEELTFRVHGTFLTYATSDSAATGTLLEIIHL